MGKVYRLCSECCLFDNFLLLIWELHRNHNTVYVKYGEKSTNNYKFVYLKLNNGRCDPECVCAGEMAAVDCECVWKLVFARFPAELFNDPFLAHELLRFLRQNLDGLRLRAPEFIRFLPNLLKVSIQNPGMLRPAAWIPAHFLTLLCVVFSMG